MDSLTVTDVRCFRNETATIRPLTLLVGENSTGKSTLLALLRAAWDLGTGKIDIDFNEDPMRLGAYDQIAHYHGGQGKRAREFKIACAFRPRRGRRASTSERVTVEAIFRDVAGQPSLLRWDAALADTRLSYSPGRNGTPGEIRGTLRGVPVEKKVNEPALAQRHGVGSMLRIALWTVAPGGPGEDVSEREDVAFEVLQVLDDLTLGGPRPLACAPIRTAPRRTYDPVRENVQPEGGHVPMVLARLATTDPKAWETLADALARFGKACGLFTSVSVHRSGKSKPGEPFQVLVGIAGQRSLANLVDVGYGVSQVLPVLVDVLTERAGWFLLQQPEVHLHPRAQAELGTFVAAMVNTGRRFVIETHSDYLVDRVCTEVRRRKYLKPNDVAILYFRREGSSVKIHELKVDEQGNIRDAPEHYRDFFRREQLSFLGIDG